MNSENANRASGAAISFVIGSVIFAVLVVAVKFLVNVPAVDADRDVVRTKALSEIRTVEASSLNTVGWADEARGIVRLPIDTAIQLTLTNWQDPAAARADLIARAERADAPAPKVAPKPNAAE
jgi:hypothetical protein